MRCGENGFEKHSPNLSVICLRKPQKKSHPALSLSCQNVNDQNKTVVLGAIVHPWRPANIFVTVFVHARWEEGDERRGYYFTSSL